MKFFLIIAAFFFTFIKIAAQSYEETYLQSEKERLEKVKTTEIDIDNFINLNINTFDFTDIINKIDKIKAENGNLLTENDYQKALLYAKKEQLRDYYFQKNPEKISYYFAKIMQQCVNGGFEDGTASGGYSFMTKKFNGQNYNAPFNYTSNPLWFEFNNNPLTAITPSANGFATVVNNSVVDPIVGIPRTHSGKYAIRLNKDDGDFDVTKMTRQFVVNQNSISFAFALVMENAGHINSPGIPGKNKNPYYQVILRDLSNNILFQRNIIADPANTTLFNGANGNSILYTNWLCEKIPTARFMGQTVTLEIILADCGEGGHFGYGYFDDFCGFECDKSSLDGNLSLNPVKTEKCPTTPIPVSGNYILPAGATYNSLELDILDAVTGNLVTTVSYPTTSGTNFVFNLSDYYFYNGFINSITKFNFKVRLLYSIGSTQYVMQATTNNPSGPDISFEGCTTPCFEIIEINQNQPVTSSQNFQAYTINASSAIHPNLLVNYRAVLEIQLKEGFYASGTDVGIFHAYIAPCEQTQIPKGNIAKMTENSSESATLLEPEIKIYPNPATNNININPGNQKLVSWELYDMSGKSVLKGSTSPIDVRSILRGSYLLKINLEKTQASKIIIVK